MRLRTQVVDLVGLDLVDQPAQAGSIRQIAIVEAQRSSWFVRIRVDVIESVCIEGGCAADNPVNLIILREQEFRKIRAVLSGDAGNERFSKSLV